MAEGNGNNKWLHWLAGTLVTLVLFIALPTMASHMITNEKARVAADKIQDKERSAIQADVREIKTDVSWIKKEIDAQGIRQEKGICEIKEMIRSFHHSG